MRILAALCLSVHFFAATAGAQSNPKGIDWPPGLSASDQRDVLALAKRMGIADPVKVEIRTTAPAIERFLVVESGVIEDSHVRRWSELEIVADNWEWYGRVPTDPKMRIGRWFAVGEKKESAKWRIRDGVWSVEVWSDPSVPYDIAQRIVLAIRHKGLANHQAIDLRGDRGTQPRVPELDASHVGSIRRDKATGAVDDGSRYVVTYWTGTYHGLDLHVRVVGSLVELFAVGAFII